MFAQSVGMFGCCVCRYVQSKIDVGECRMLAPPPPTSGDAARSPCTGK